MLGTDFTLSAGKQAYHARASIVCDCRAVRSKFTVVYGNARKGDCLIVAVRTQRRINSTSQKTNYKQRLLDIAREKNGAVEEDRTFNPLKTKRRLLYLKTQFVPRSKHFSSRL